MALYILAANGKATLTGSIQLRVAKHHFAFGSFRNVFLATMDHHAGAIYVVKEYKADYKVPRFDNQCYSTLTTSQMETLVAQDAVAQVACATFVDEISRRANIEFKCSAPSVLVGTGNSPRVLAMEPLLPHDKVPGPYADKDRAYTKFNRNATVVKDAAAPDRSSAAGKFAQMVSHGSFIASSGKILVVDLQGTCTSTGNLPVFLTDPQVVSIPRCDETADEHIVGSVGNLGGATVKTFIAQHICGEACQAMNLAPFAVFSELYIGLVVYVHPSVKDVMTIRKFSSILGSMGAQAERTLSEKCHVVCVHDLLNQEDYEIKEPYALALRNSHFTQAIKMSFFLHSEDTGVSLYKSLEIPQTFVGFTRQVASRYVANLTTLPPAPEAE